MYIPENIINIIEGNADPMDNNYFNHATSALNSINKVSEDNYCYDHISMAINTLERIYKGFIKAAVKECEWYQMPYDRFLTDDHDLIKLIKEIKANFPDVFPREDTDSWRATKNFLRDLRMEYSAARYDSYPTYDNLINLRRYINQQFNIIKEYIESGKLEDKNDVELKEDY